MLLDRKVAALSSAAIKAKTVFESPNREPGRSDVSTPPSVTSGLFRCIFVLCLFRPVNALLQVTADNVQ